jgi:hypothetical protein
LETSHKRIEELNQYIQDDLIATLEALEGTTSEHKDMVVSKYLTTLEMLCEGVRSIKYSIEEDLKDKKE